MQKMAEAIPGAQFVQIPNAGHLSPLENPDAVSGAINRFLISLESRPAT
jgi:pimeloyl-ACP methyl ester carboxylesterase